MASVAATATRTARIPRWATPASYLAVLVAAESLIAADLQEAGLTVHILLVFALLFHSVLVHDRDRVLGSLLVAQSLSSLIRIFSLAVPHYPNTDPPYILPWLGLVSVPLLVTVASVAYVQRLGPRALGLGFPWGRNLAFQAGIGLTGVPFGLLEYYILRPEAWPTTAILGGFAGAVLAIFLATGLAEELIFRGILLTRAIEGLGVGPGILFVTLTFTSLHIFYRNAFDLAFVFAVGLTYAWAVFKTKNLWGVIASHSLANVLLYLIAPTVLPAMSL